MPPRLMGEHQLFADEKKNGDAGRKTERYEGYS